MAELPRRLSYCASAQMIVFAIALALLLLPGATAPTQISIETCGALLLLHSIWALWSWRRVSGALFDPYVLFLLSATLFNAGLGLLAVFGLNSEPVLSDFPPDIAVRSLLLVLAALAGLHCGALLAVSPRRRSEIDESPVSGAALRITGFMLLALSLVPLLFQLRSAVSVAASGGYMALYQQHRSGAGAGSAVRTVAELILPGACFVLAGSARRHLYRIAAFAVLLPYCCTLLLLGYRGHSILPLVGVAWLWDRTIGRIPRLPIAAAAAILLTVVFPFVRATRELSAAERTKTSAIELYSGLVDHPAVSTLAEMGGSVITVAYTIELVPAHRPYDLGMGYVYALLTIVPSLFWERHPSVARAPTTWLVEIVEPISAKEGATLGFSFIADAYLNFGAFGVPFFALLMGFGVVRICRWAEGSAARLAVVATWMPPLLLAARSEIADLPRPVVWYGLVPYALYLLVRRRLEKAASMQPQSGALGPLGQER